MSGSAPYTNQPPDAQDALTRILEQTRRLPCCMPPNASMAAQWWLKMQKPMTRHEWPSRKSLVRGDGMRWDTPYIDKIKVNLHKFLALKPADHEFIVAALEDGCWWNGHNMTDFRFIYDETMRMKDIGTDRYIREISARTRALIKGSRSEKSPVDSFEQDQQFEQHRQQ